MAHDFISRLAELRLRAASHDRLQEFRATSEEAAELQAELADLLGRLEEVEAEAARLRRRVAELGQASTALHSKMKRELKQLGYDEDALSLLFAVPLLVVAWSDGKVSSEEARRIRDAAHARGVQPGSPAADRLERWLAERPSDEQLATLLEITRDLLLSLPESERAEQSRDLVSYCFAVAEASGSLLGRRVSDAEQQAIRSVVAMVESAHTNAAERIRTALGNSAS